jgi:hypothetical protein
MSRPSDTDIYSQAGDWLVGTARRNPEALLLLAAGAALLMRSGRQRPPAPGYTGEAERAPSYASQPNHGAEAMRRTARQAGETVAGYAADMRNQVVDTASGYAAAVTDFAADAGRTVSESSQRFARQAQSTMEGTVDRVLRNQPLAVAAAGLAAGALVAATFPTTEIESRTLGGAHEALTDAVDKARETVVTAASKAGERLKSAAEERGLTAEGLKDLAGEVADTFTESVGHPGTEGTRTVADSPATADFGGSETGAEKGSATKSWATVGSGGGPKR